MDYGRENRLSSDDVVHVLARNSVSESWGGGFVEDDYGMWDAESCLDGSGGSDGGGGGGGGGSEPPSKRSRGDMAASNRSRAIGKIFYKTKLCCKFRAGTCPYITNCNFAHSVEELRRPPDNWQDIVAAAAAREEERGSSSEPREEFQIPIIVGVSDEAQRSYKGRHCKNFCTEEGCPYGESCTFLHDEHSKARESVAISLGPGSASGSTLKPSNWKTRICNKWEVTGYCPFGSKFHFAHGAAEMHQYGGEPTDSEMKDSDAKQAVRTTVDAVVLAHSEGYHVQMGVPSSQRLPSAILKTGYIDLTRNGKALIKSARFTATGSTTSEEVDPAVRLRTRMPPRRDRKQKEIDTNVVLPLLLLLYQMLATL